MVEGVKMLKDVTIGLKAALLLILVMMAYMCSVTFFEVPDSGMEQAKTIVPFLLGVIATLVGFYWGNSHKETPLPVITPVDEAAIAAAKVVAKDVVKDNKVEEVKSEEVI